MDITALTTPDVPVEIVNSIQEVIKDSAPGAAVDRMREELEDMRDSMDSSRHVMEGLRVLVIDLVEQGANSSINATVCNLEHQKESKDPLQVIPDSRRL